MCTFSGENTCTTERNRLLLNQNKHCEKSISDLKDDIDIKGVTSSPHINNNNNIVTSDEEKKPSLWGKVRKAFKIISKEASSISFLKI